MALRDAPVPLSGGGIRDGQSLAEASATLFKDILIGPSPKEGFRPTRRLCSRPTSSGAAYPLSLPPSLRFEDIQFLRSAAEPPRGLRRNASLHSLWNAWDEQAGGTSSSSKRVISGVPGLGHSVSASVVKKKKFSLAETGTRASAAAPRQPRHKVTFNLPEEGCCCCCSCCSCCSSSSYSPLSCCGPLLPPSLPPKVSSPSSHPPSSHYASPAPRDGDYSYAYDSSVSPAFLIKWREEQREGGTPLLGRRENLYEEIVDVHEQIKKFSVSSAGRRDSPTPVVESNSDSGIGNLVCSSGTLDMKKSLVQRANSFSSRDVYIPSRRISVHPPTCNNHKCCVTSRALAHNPEPPPEAASLPSPSSSSSPSSPSSGPEHKKTEGESPTKIKGLFKRVLNKWSHC